ncbi:innexin unc-9-like isoform X2 [Mercenaria mercenaria]|uniref:innexin unc-9-like isoform X2 n=1 Tax=Mercenaria mercenaria TaxID=6596 RepID=UPI00234E94CE|nr:innexin unc-9-like isoform X2 [Mercenaria mercenaria]
MVISNYDALSPLKLFSSSHCDDWVDRLSHAVTVLLLLAFAITVSTTHIVEPPISCWVPAEFDKGTGSFEDYVNTYCWLKNTYYIPMLEEIPTDVLHRQQEEITYYQWVPLIFLLQALLFKLPHILWKILRNNCGLELGKLCKTAGNTQCQSPAERSETISVIVFSILCWIKGRQRYIKQNACVRAKTWLSRFCCFYGNKREGTFLTALYLAIKLLYLTNVIGQIFLLNAFITTDKSVYALEWLGSFHSSSSFVESKRFPKVTLCDYQIRQMNNVKKYTVQCVLPINMFNEKLFLFLWFWFCLLAILNVFSMANWLYLIIWKKNNYNFVMKYFKIDGQRLKQADKEACKKFTEDFLRNDGCFLVRMVGMNSSELVVIDLLKELFTQYKKDQKQSRATSHDDQNETEQKKVK